MSRPAPLRGESALTAAEPLAVDLHPALAGLILLLALLGLESLLRRPGPAGG